MRVNEGKQFRNWKIIEFRLMASVIVDEGDFEYTFWRCGIQRESMNYRIIRLQGPRSIFIGLLAKEILNFDL